MTPRTIVPAVIALLFLAGCASTGGPAPHSPGSQALDARIFPVTDLGSRTMLSVVTNRPASVAVFEILPGSGAALVHPRYGQGGDLHGGGIQWIDLDYVPGRWMYQSTMQVTHGPRYYLLVASTRGLDIDRLRSPSAIRSSLGFQAFTSYSANRTIESLVQLAVGDLALHDYVTDVYVVWPTPAPLIPRYASGIHQRVIQCPTGQLVRWIIECPSVAVVGTYPVDPPPVDTAGARDEPPNRPRPGEASAGDRTERPVAVPRPAAGERERVRSVTEEARETPRRPPAARPTPPARERPRPSPEARPSPPPARERSRPQPETRPAPAPRPEPAPRPAPPPQRDSPPDNDVESPARS